MNWRAFLSVLAAVSLSLSAHAEDAKKTADDFAGRWVAAYNSGDAAALAALFTADGVFNAPSGAVVRGREAIEKALAGRIKAGWTKETVTTSDAGAAGSAVWAAGDYALQGSGEVAGKESGGHFGWVLVNDGGAWHVVMLTANVTPPK
jgi:uncharacterized protein (TIGR02246 family)